MMKDRIVANNDDDGNEICLPKLTYRVFKQNHCRNNSTIDSSTSLFKNKLLLNIDEPILIRN